MLIQQRNGQLQNRDKINTNKHKQIRTNKHKRIAHK